MTALPLVCPAHMGVVITGGDHDRLHRYTLERNLTEMKKLLKKGVDVNCGDHLGRTPLFCAALHGQVRATELLLHYGADPNHRCEDWCTPVHAGVFSCNTSVVSVLLNAGGNLRVHDREGRTPIDWLRGTKQDGRAECMQSFLNSCVSSMQQLLKSTTKKKLHCSPTHVPSLEQPASLLDHRKSCGSDMQLTERANTMSSCTTAHSFGFGEVCADKRCQMLGVPLIRESDLTQSEDETSFTSDCVTSMTKCSWRGTSVTVKAMRESHMTYLDLTLIEQEYCSQLFHPQLLQMMAVALSDDLQRTSLVFESVDVGTLHNVLHDRPADFPVLTDDRLRSVVLQVIDGLLYLHQKGLVMRALSSHSVVFTTSAVVKLTNLGFMVPSSKDACVRPPMSIVLPPSLYRWAAPEAIKQLPCTQEADIYSLCALIQELYTESEPWGAMDPDVIRQAVEAGQALTADRNIPQPYYDVVLKGLRQHPEDRRGCLQTMHYILQQEAQRRPTSRSAAFAREESDSVWESAESDAEYNTPYQSFPRVKEGTIKAERVVGKQIHVDKQLYRQAKAELERKTVECMEGESMRHPQFTYKDMLTLGHSLDCVWASVVEEFGAEADVMEQLDGSKPYRVTTDHHIRTIEAALKVGQELLQEANRSLDALEEHLAKQQSRGAKPEPSQLDYRDAPPCTYPTSSSTSSISSFPMPSSHLSAVSTAVGPPSKRSSLLSHEGYSWAKNPEDQLLSGKCEPLSQEELSLWRSHFPFDQEDQRVSGLHVTESCSVGVDQSTTEQSQYKSALDYSLFTPLSVEKLQIYSCSQKQLISASQENADVTVGVCRPAATGNPLPENESFPNSCEKTDTESGVSGTYYTPNTHMARSDMGELAELSSIRHSQQQETLGSIFIQKRAPPCNSTPRSTDVMTSVPQTRLPDFPAYSLVSSVNVSSESLSTSGESSLKGNIFPPSPSEVESSPPHFVTASEDEGPLTDAFSSVHTCCRTEEGEHEAEVETGADEAGGSVIEEEERGRCDTQRDVGSKVKEMKDEEDGVDRLKKTFEVFGSGEGEDNSSVRCGSCLGLIVHPQELESPSLMEDTDRAHAVLDDVLRDFVVDNWKKPRTK